MANNDICIVDTREKKNKTILNFFDEVGQDYIVSKLEAGDYMFYKKPKILIDKKDGLLELAHNLCNKKEHERVVREILKAKELGCEKFIFLIQADKIKNFADIKSWSSPHTKVKGSTLFNIMATMSVKYDIKFVFVSKKDMGKMILNILRDNKETI